MMEAFLAITAGGLLAMYRVLLRALWRDVRASARYRAAMDTARRLMDDQGS